MKPVDERRLEALESTIEPAVKAIKEYLAYEGTNPTFQNKAKASVGVISAYARMRASETNRIQVELIANRVDSQVAREFESHRTVETITDGIDHAHS